MAIPFYGISMDIQFSHTPRFLVKDIQWHFHYIPIMEIHTSSAIPMAFAWLVPRLLWRHQGLACAAPSGSRGTSGRGLQAKARRQGGSIHRLIDVNLVYHWVILGILCIVVCKVYIHWGILNKNYIYYILYIIYRVNYQLGHLLYIIGIGLVAALLLLGIDILTSMIHEVIMYIDDLNLNIYLGSSQHRGGPSSLPFIKNWNECI